jgi:hypothetical protein
MSTVQFGNAVGTTPAMLLDDREVPFNNFNIFFSDAASPAAGQNRIQVGDFNVGASTSNFPAFSEFSSIRDEDYSGLRIGGLNSTSSIYNPSSLPIAFNPLYFGNISTAFQRMGTVSLAYESVSGGQRFIGLSAGAYSGSSVLNLGVSGKAFGNTTNNTGVWGIAGASSCSSTNYGVSGTINSPGTNFGVFGSAVNGLTNYAVYGDVSSVTTGSCGAATNYAGYFNGDVVINGSIIPSDSVLKQNINTLANALDLLAQLQPKTFEYKSAAYPSMSFPTGIQHGLIAQDVESVLPSVVNSNIHPPKYDSTGTMVYPAVHYKGIKYEQFIPIMIKGIQEQEATIDSLQTTISRQDSINNSLQSQISTLAEIIDACCGSGHSMSHNGGVAATSVVLKDAQNIVLDQNVPNPFAEQTTISYFLPENTAKAQMLFYNAQGKLIHVVDLKDKGQGLLNVFASDLSSGIYTYTLVVDGKVHETKKMIRQ